MWIFITLYWRWLALAALFFAVVGSAYYVKSVFAERDNLKVELSLAQEKNKVLDNANQQLVKLNETTNAVLLETTKIKQRIAIQYKEKQHAISQQPFDSCFDSDLPSGVRNVFNPESASAARAASGNPKTKGGSANLPPVVDPSN